MLCICSPTCRCSIRASVQFILLTVMILVVCFLIWITIPR